jgi:hypothetical protein
MTVRVHLFPDCRTTTGPASPRANCINQSGASVDLLEYRRNAGAVTRINFITVEAWAAHTEWPTKRMHCAQHEALALEARTRSGTHARTLSASEPENSALRSACRTLADRRRLACHDLPTGRAAH